MKPVPIGFLDLIPEIPNVSKSCRRAGLVGEFYANVVGVIFVLNAPSLKQCVFVLEFLVSECGDEFTREGLLFAERRVRLRRGRRNRCQANGETEDYR